MGSFNCDAAPAMAEKKRFLALQVVVGVKSEKNETTRKTYYGAEQKLVEDLVVVVVAPLVIMSLSYFKTLPW